MTISFLFTDIAKNISFHGFLEVKLMRVGTLVTVKLMYQLNYPQNARIKHYL